MVSRKIFKPVAGLVYALGPKPIMFSLFVMIGSN